MKRTNKKGMFKNAGAKLEILAKILFVISVIIMAIVSIGLADIVEDAIGINYFLSFVLVLIVGIIIPYINSLIICALGQMVDNTQRIAENTENIYEEVSKQQIENKGI